MAYKGIGISWPIQTIDLFSASKTTAANEADFIRQIEPHTKSASNKYTITRINPSRPELPVVVSINPPLKVTWPEKVPKYLQIYQGGEVYQEGFFNSGEPIGLPASAILYEIKMSRERGFPQSYQWVLVENPPFTHPNESTLSYR